MNGFLSLNIFSLYSFNEGGQSSFSVATFLSVFMISAKSTPTGHQFVQFSQPVHKNKTSYLFELRE